MSESFAMICCQQGAEPAVKQEIAQGWRLAFSRPGFITFKNADASKQALPEGVFVRYAGWSLGKVTDEHVETAAANLSTLLSGQKFQQLHIWQRDRAPVGHFNFEPGTTVIAQSVAEVVFPQLAAAGIVTGPKPNHTAEPGQRVLDIILVEPTQWWIGWHEAIEHRPETSWPGGTPKLTQPADMVSRTYLKTAEAISWAEFPFRPNDIVVEVGSAPGGSVQRLLELGMRVIGIDPADMDPVIADHPNFKHFRARGGDLKRTVYRNARWLVVDSNVRPEKTLVTVENIVTNRDVRIQGMLVTLKLSDYEMARDIPNWMNAIRRWGYSEVRARQLAFGKTEICIAARRGGRE